MERQPDSCIDVISGWRMVQVLQETGFEVTHVRGSHYYLRFPGKAHRMSRPSRQTTTGRIYLDLRALAWQRGRPTGEILVLFVLERFLYRFSRSVPRDRLVLTGGMLLAVFALGRLTGRMSLFQAAPKVTAGRSVASATSRRSCTPSALARRSSVAKVGEVPPASSRAMAEAVVPMRVASSFCVRPAALRSVRVSMPNS